MTTRFTRTRVWFGLIAATAPLLGCGAEKRVQISGSSTVGPITEVAIEEFETDHGGIDLSLGMPGTSAGMTRFLLKEVDICNASRPIKEAELAEAKAKGIEVVEIVAGYDGLAVVANKDNDWCDSLSVDQLKSIWRPEAEATVTNWNQVSESFPDQPLKLFGAGQASGTFEYFTEAIVGEAKKSRSDYTASENDNMLVRGVEGEKGGLGYFGYAYYSENKDNLKLLAVDGGDGPVKPSQETVLDGTYKPLSRPLFMYVSKESLKRPEVAEFVSYFVKNGGDFAEKRGYVRPSAEQETKNQKSLAAALK